MDANEVLVSLLMIVNLCGSLRFFKLTRSTYNGNTLVPQNTTWGVLQLYTDYIVKHSRIQKPAGL